MNTNQFEIGTTYALTFAGETHPCQYREDGRFHFCGDCKDHRAICRRRGHETRSYNARKFVERGGTVANV